VKKPPRIIGGSPAGNRCLPASAPAYTVADAQASRAIELPPEPGWPDRDGECAGCASLLVRVAALEIEVETLLGSSGRHEDLIADLNGRLSRDTARAPGIFTPPRFDAEYFAAMTMLDGDVEYEPVESP